MSDDPRVNPAPRSIASRRRRAPRRARRPAGGSAGWTAPAIAIAAAAALLLASCAPLAGRGLWLTDIAANLAAQIGIVSAAGCVVFLLLRKRAASVIAGLGAVLAALAVLAPGLDLDARRVFTEPPRRPDQRVRVLVANLLAGNENRSVANVILRQNADVLCLHEPPGWMIEELKAGGRWREAYPHYWVSDRAGPGFRVLLSRWPQHDARSLRRGARFAAIRVGRVAVLDRPAGALAIANIHPRSPRTPERWRQGLEIARGVAELHHEHIEPRGLPLIVAGDLNSTPTGGTSTRLASSLGLRRAKPVPRATGTFGPLWPAAIAIDGVLAPPEARVTAWRTLELPGSDHDALLVELELPPPPTDPLADHRG